MPIFSRLMFQAVRWASRRGLREEGDLSTETKGETYAYWYLRRNGYVFVARNYTPRGIKGELDLVGYDGKTLALSKFAPAR
jgi:putative endonuclease